MLILQIALGILLAGFLYRYWRRVGIILVATIGLVVVIAFWQQTLGLLVGAVVSLAALVVAKPHSGTLSQKDSRKMR